MKYVISSLFVSLCVASGAIAAPEKYEGKVVAETDDKGNLSRETKESYTDTQGTAHTSVIQEDVKVKNSGKSVSKVTTKSTTDPKGLGNKSWNDGTSRVEARSDGSERRSVESKSVDAAGTAKRSYLEEDTEIAKDGTAKTVSRETAVVDPQGLMNKRTAKTEVTTLDHPSGHTEVTTERHVDGRKIGVEKITR